MHVDKVATLTLNIYLIFDSTYIGKKRNRSFFNFKLLEQEWLKPQHNLF